MTRPFPSVLSALSWFWRERQRRDGLRASPCDPRVVSAINGPKTGREDRLLLLAVIDGCWRRTPVRHRRILLLMVVEGLTTPVELGGALKISERRARETMTEAQEAVGRRLRKVGVVAGGNRQERYERRGGGR